MDESVPVQQRFSDHILDTTQYGSDPGDSIYGATERALQLRSIGSPSVGQPSRIPRTLVTF